MEYCFKWVSCCLQPPPFLFMHLWHVHIKRFRRNGDVCIYCSRTMGKYPNLIADSWFWDHLWFLEIYLEAVRYCFGKIDFQKSWNWTTWQNNSYNFFQGELGEAEGTSLFVRLFYVIYSCLKAFTALFTP